MSIWELYTQLIARNWRCRRFVRSLSEGCSEIRKKDVVMTARRWLSWSIQIPQFLMLWWPGMKAGFTAMSQRPRDRVPSGSMLALPDPRRPDRANPPTNVWWSTCTRCPLDRQSIPCWGFKGVLEEIPSEEARTLQIRSVAFPLRQCTSPQLTDYLTKIDIKTVPQPPYSPDLAPCDFWLFPKLKEKLRGCSYDTIEEMKEAVAKVIDTLTQEGFHWAFQKLLEW